MCKAGRCSVRFSGAPAKSASMAPDSSRARARAMSAASTSAFMRCLERSNSSAGPSKLNWSKRSLPCNHLTRGMSTLCVASRVKWFQAGDSESTQMSTQMLSVRRARPSCTAANTRNRWLILLGAANVSASRTATYSVAKPPPRRASFAVCSNLLKLRAPSPHCVGNVVQRLEQNGSLALFALGELRQPAG